MPPSYETSDGTDVQSPVPATGGVVEESSVGTDTGTGVSDTAPVVSDREALLTAPALYGVKLEEATIALDFEPINLLYSPCMRLSMCTACTYFIYPFSALSVTMFKVSILIIAVTTCSSISSLNEFKRSELIDCRSHSALYICNILLDICSRLSFRDIATVDVAQCNTESNPIREMYSWER